MTLKDSKNTFLVMFRCGYILNILKEDQDLISDFITTFLVKPLGKAPASLGLLKILSKTKLELESPGAKRLIWIFI